MFINSIDPTTFGVNLNSPKLRYSKQDFFVKIHGYGRNPLWANKTIETADTAVHLVRRDTSIENVLKFITTGVRRANQFCLDLAKRQHTGVLRTYRAGWKSEDWLTSLETPYKNNRYSAYKWSLDRTYNEPLKRPNSIIGMTRPDQDSILHHGKADYINRSLDYILKLSNQICPKYINQEVKPENMEEINSIIAEIRWGLAHATPWTRGSDAISNVFMRVIYKAIGVKSYPLKQGLSLDLEAYCTELDEYKKRFPEYFEKPPEIVD